MLLHFHMQYEIIRLSKRQIDIKINPQFSVIRFECTQRYDSTSADISLLVSLKYNPPGEKLNPMKPRCF